MGIVSMKDILFPPGKFFPQKSLGVNEPIALGKFAELFEKRAFKVLPVDDIVTI